MALPILIVNGPNLNMLGMREPDIYGGETLSDIEARCVKHAETLALKAECFQSNDEGTLITRLQQAVGEVSGIIINAGAYTHTSIALRDALLLHRAPIIEVHLSNIFAREEFRHHSYISGVARGVICGLGAEGYLLAITALRQLTAH